MPMKIAMRTYSQKRMQNRRVRPQTLLSFSFFAPDRRTSWYRAALVLALLLGAVALQNSGGLLPEIGGARALVLLPFVCVSAMFSTPATALALGAAAGVLWDVSSAAPDGLSALFLGLVGFLCAFLVNRYMRNNLRTALLLCFAAIFAFVMLRMLLYLPSAGLRDLPALMRYYFLPTLLYTFLLSPLIYGILKHLYSLVFAPSARIQNVRGK